MVKIYIGVDNGVTGSFALLSEEGKVEYFPTPVVKELNYTKTKAWIHRIDRTNLEVNLTRGLTNLGGSFTDCRAALERPMVNPMRFRASVSALRALEATLIILETLGISYSYIDSKEWQHVMLPKGLEKEELKKASTDVCRRLFPQIKLKKDGDGDSLLIAEYLRRKK